MTLSKNAIGNLINKYRAVLSKCRLLNTLGSLAVAGALVLGMGELGVNGFVGKRQGVMGNTMLKYEF